MTLNISNDMKNDNELIAEFMGVKSRRQVGIFSMDEYIEISPKGKQHWQKAEYAQSWDWLMPVVEMIESLDFMCSIECHCCIIKHNSKEPDYYIITNIKGDVLNKIGATHKAVVEFIKWYNTQQHGN